MDGVLTENLGVEERFAQRSLFAEQNAVAIKSLAGDAVEAFGDVETFEFEFGASAGRGAETFTGKTEAVLGEFVAVAADEKENIAIHQAGFVERNPTGIVGEEAEVVDCFEFDERHAATGCFVNDADAEWRGVGAM